MNSHYGAQVDVSLVFDPFWSRNRLTFLRNERYQAMLGPHLLPGSGPGDSIMTETDLPYLDVPPLLVAGSSDEAIERGRRTAEAFGIRLGEAMRTDDVRGRLERQASASALWIELEDLGAEWKASLERTSVKTQETKHD